MPPFRAARNASPSSSHDLLVGGCATACGDRALQPRADRRKGSHPPGVRPVIGTHSHALVVAVAHRSNAIVFAYRTSGIVSAASTIAPDRTIRRSPDGRRVVACILP